MSQSVAHARRPFSQPVPVEVLEVRTLMSVTNSEGGNVVPAHDLGLYFSPIAHDVGPYYAPHGKAFPGSVAPVTINDVGATSIISGGLSATVSNTPGGGSATYQISCKSVVMVSKVTRRERSMNSLVGIFIAAIGDVQSSALKVPIRSHLVTTLGLSMALETMCMRFEMSVKFWRTIYFERLD